jgi:hypothetical protein
MQLPSTTEEALLHAAAPTASGVAAFMDQVRGDVVQWVRATVLRATASLGSATQRLNVVGDRQHVASALALLQGQRERLVQALTEAIQHELDILPDAASDARSAPAPRAAAEGPLELTLIGEAQIDEDIEIARIIEVIESECEAELGHLTALTCALRGLPYVLPDAAPLPPLVCAAGLRAGLLPLAPDAGPRLLLLRELGAALGRELRDVYGALADHLTRQGVQPAQYRIRRTPATKVGGTVAAPPGPSADDAEAASVAATAALRQLVERASRGMAPRAPDTAPGDLQAAGEEAFALRLFDEPTPARPAGPALEPAAAVHLMERLLAQIEQRLGASPGAQALLSDLRGPARALARRETQLWNSLDHPWWQLLDRLLAAASVHDDDGRTPGALTQSLGAVVRRMGQSGTADRAACQAAVDGVEQVVAHRLQQRCSELELHSRDLQSQVDREDVEAELRQQVVLQLRGVPVCPGLRQFLVGAWTQAITQVALRHGQNSRALDAMAYVVDDLLRATARPGQPVSEAQRAVLMRQVRDGLLETTLPATRVAAELADLNRLLLDPPAVQEPGWDDAVDTLPLADSEALQAGLPTVPVLPMGTAFDTMLEAAAHQSWLDLLQPGSCCRMFLLGRWMTAQLSWVSASRNLYVFTSRQGARTHSLTRRMLTKLRNAGLATSIDDGFLLAQALDGLAQSDIGSG